MAVAIDRASLTELSARCSGMLLGPDDAGYDEARRVHNGMIDKRPALIARCRGSADVADAVTFGRRHGLDIAVRGGGGNFGVVPWFEYRLHPVGPLTSGLVAHPVGRARDVLRFYRDATRSLPDELTLFGGLLHAPDGSGTRLAAIIAAHSGSLAEGEAALRPIKAFGSPLMDVIGPTSYEATNMMLDAGFPRGALNYWKATFLTELSDAAIDTMVAGFQSCPSPMSGMLLEHFHGAVTRVGPTDTAFPHRGEAYNLVIISEWLDPAESVRNIAWARQTYDAMRPYAAGARYVNYLGDDETGNPAEAAYGPNLPRLRAIKARYDPANVFQMNQNIRPA